MIGEHRTANQSNTKTYDKKKIKKKQDTEFRQKESQLEKGKLKE